MNGWIIWDWNGTLLDDTTAALAAFNTLLSARGLKPVSLAFYRENFSFPVKSFYARSGIDPAKEDWNAVGRDYHEAYAREPKALNVEAKAALAMARESGFRQAILSALRQDLLEQALDEYGIRAFFDFVYGSDNLDGGSKLDRGRELLQRLRAASPDATDLAGRTFLVGDAVHDAEVASALGVRCILCAQGGHSAERLRAVAPTCDTLLDCVRDALSLQRRMSKPISRPDRESDAIQASK